MADRSRSVSSSINHRVGETDVEGPDDFALFGRKAIDAAKEFGVWLLVWNPAIDGRIAVLEHKGAGYPTSCCSRRPTW
jgi:hypothetical protein